MNVRSTSSCSQQQLAASRCSRCTAFVAPRHTLLASSRAAHRVRASAAAGQDTAAEAVPLVEVTLRKPVGVVFAQKAPGGPVIVEEVTPGGEADRSGRVRVGDVLARCSAVVLKDGTEGQYATEGYGQRPYTNFERVAFDCAGQDFKTVMSALKSNNARWGIMDVTLWLRREGSQ